MSRAFHGKIGFGIWFDLDSQRVISMQCRSIIFEVFPSHPHERITNYDRRCLLKSIEECTALRASIEHRSNLKNARKQQQHRTKTTFFLGKKNCDSVCNGVNSGLCTAANSPEREHDKNEKTQSTFLK